MHGDSFFGREIDSVIPVSAIRYLLLVLMQSLQLKFQN